MPNKKGDIPWNKGLTHKTDSRIPKSKRQIIFSKEEIIKIKNLYLNGITTIEIGKAIGCSSHPIADLLKNEGIMKSVSEVRKEIYNKNYIKVKECIYNGIALKIIDGRINIKNGILTSTSKIELKCIECGYIFIRTLNCYQSSLKHNDNKIRCNKCSNKKKYFEKDRKVKTSQQQIQISIILNAILNYKINKMYVDMVLLNDRIIIEYDGWTWHGDEKNQIRDRRRDEYLKNLGWKILRIKGKRNIPLKNEIDDKIQILKENKVTYVEIIMEDWGKGKTFTSTKKEDMI